MVKNVRRAEILIDNSFATAGRTTCFQKKDSAFSRHLCAICTMKVASSEALLFEDASPTASSTTYSLAGSYLVECASVDHDGCTIWILVSLNDSTIANSAMYSSGGARAWAALQGAMPSTAPRPSVVLMAAFSSANHLEISTTSNDTADLVIVLSRILAQRILAQRQPLTENVTTIQFSGSETNCVTATISDLEKLSSPSTNWNDVCDSDNFIRNKLFADLDKSNSELVEMVDRYGDLLGVVPRILVHKHNLLHRGVGMFVTKDLPIDMEASSRQPDLYCHRRSATKRIFPTLYDMFVGGVSLAGEEATLTARREVAEELGLTAAMIGIAEEQACIQLSDRLLRCLVCTGYNRCVVDLYSYTMDTAIEVVTLQEEEVAWGAFVPYSIVNNAADRSIGRLAASNDWPGRHPPFQSLRELDLPAYTSVDAPDWTTWDFVPDGLLVWEAWLRATHK